MSDDCRFTLAVASGKGGTGKTLVSSNLAVLSARAGQSVALVDCDVEAPNDHLFFSAISTLRTGVDSLVARVDKEACSGCGACSDACAYGAIRVLGGSALVFDALCHGCGLCPAICPTAAIREVPQRVGEVEVSSVSDHEGLVLVTGRLDVGQTKSPSVIRAAREAGVRASAQLVVLDAPPGVACSAVAAMRGADALLLITEPTPFGLHDLELTLHLGRDLGIPMGVLVNRDIGTTDRIDALSRHLGAVIVGQIPFERSIAEAYARGALVTEEVPAVRTALSGVVARMRRIAAGGVRCR